MIQIYTSIFHFRKTAASAPISVRQIRSELFERIRDPRNTNTCTFRGRCLYRGRNACALVLGHRQVYAPNLLQAFRQLSRHEQQEQKEKKMYESDSSPPRRIRDNAPGKALEGSMTHTGCANRNAERGGQEQLWRRRRRRRRNGGSR